MAFQFLQIIKIVFLLYLSTYNVIFKISKTITEISHLPMTIKRGV